MHKNAYNSLWLLFSESNRYMFSYDNPFFQQFWERSVQYFHIPLMFCSALGCLLCSPAISSFFLNHFSIVSVDAYHGESLVPWAFWKLHILQNSKFAQNHRFSGILRKSTCNFTIYDNSLMSMTLMRRGFIKNIWMAILAEMIVATSKFYW